MCVCVCVCVYLQVELLGSRGHPLCKFLRSCQNLFHKGETVLHSHWLRTRVPISLYTCQYLFSFSSFMFVNYNSLVRYKVVSHCSFDLYLMKSGVECILMYLLGKTFCFEFGLLRLNYFYNF